MQLQLITLSGVKYSADTHAITLPTASGKITVLAHHEPLMSVLVPGVISVRKNAKDPETAIEHYATYGGVVEVTGATTRVLVDEADLGEDINQQEAEKARAAAEKMKAEAKNRVELERAQAVIDRQAVRIQVAGLRRRHRG